MRWTRTCKRRCHNLRKSWKIAGAALAVFAILVYGSNASWLVAPPGGKPLLLANRGMAQSFARGHIGNEDCTARLIATPRHAFLENTIASIRAAFDAGAGIVEIQV